MAKASISIDFRPVTATPARRHRPSSHTAWSRPGRTPSWAARSPGAPAAYQVGMLGSVNRLAVRPPPGWRPRTASARGTGRFWDLRRNRIKVMALDFPPVYGEICRCPTELHAEPPPGLILLGASALVPPPWPRRARTPGSPQLQSAGWTPDAAVAGQRHPDRRSPLRWRDRRSQRRRAAPARMAFCRQILGD